VGRLSALARVTRITGDLVASRDDHLAVEEPLQILVDGSPLTVTMRTPGHDVDLVLGFLVAEGTIGSPDDVVSAAFCTPPGQANSYNVLAVRLRVPGPRPRQVLTSSACGICGRTSIEDVRQSSRHQPVEDLVPVSTAVLAALPERLREAQRLFASTGGLHAAGLFTATGELLVAREDVGRHNAVDKVVGWALRERGLPLPGTVLMVSGRASFELVQKAHLAGISTLAAVSAPSSLAVELAREVGMTLVGFLRGDTMNVYAGVDRVEVTDGQAAAG
jgi:FdhD protein